MSNTLSGATNHFEFRELPHSKIILSKECYTRLAGDISLCALSSDQELEYGTILYGNEIEPNIIYFDVPSDYDDYEPKYREFDVNLDREGKESKMYKELTQRIEKSKYDCIAHIHTHPFIGGTCRMFSNQDLKMIKSLQQDFQPRNGTNKYFFGGLLTVGPENTPETDEISFVFFDENYGWYKITNINVFLNNEEIPFSSVGERTKMQLR